jgi:hypothetical protein
MSEWSRITNVPQQHAFLRDHLAGAWNDGPALSMAVEEFRPAYEVQGRRRNGSVKGEHPVRWFSGRILLPIRTVLLVPVALLVDDIPPSTFRRSRVTGPANGIGVGFADATRAEHQKVRVDPCWFVWTRNRSALIRIGEDFQITTLWQGDGPYRPHVDPPTRTLRWRDNSTVTLHLSAWETQQAAQLPAG